MTQIAGCAFGTHPAFLCFERLFSGPKVVWSFKKNRIFARFLTINNVIENE